MKSKLGYKLVSEPMLAAIMSKDAPALLKQSYAGLDDFDLMLIKQEMQAQGVPEPSEAGYLSGNELEAELAVPALLGADISDHFEAMADEYLAPVMPLIAELLSAQEPILPDAQTMLQAIEQYGADCWHTFGLLGEYEKSDSTLPVKAFIYDTETNAFGPSHFAMPIIATAMSNGKSHIWVSQHLLNGADSIAQILDNLPSLGSDKLIVAHNIGYDGGRYQERYSTEQKNYGICTMSWHQQCAGLDANMRWAAGKSFEGYAPKWLKHGSLKSLVAAYNFHCAPQGYAELGKDAKNVRNIFVQCTLPEILEQLPSALEYAMHDVLYTLRLFKAIWPKYKAVTPSNVPLAAQMLLSHSLLQIDSEWHSWLKRCDEAAKAEEASISKAFADISAKYVAQWQADKTCFEDDPWLADLDWACKGHDEAGNELPAWFCWSNGGADITAKSVLSHYILKLQWNGKPLQRSKELAWHYIDDSGKAIQLPHKNGEGNVGNALAPHYLAFIEDGTLSSPEPACKAIMNSLTQCSFWAGHKARMMETAAFAVQNPANGMPALAIAPSVCPANTVSLRTGENLFLVLAAHTQPKIAAEIKSKVKAWPGYNCINYDIDSMELNALARFSDSFAGLIGSTALSYSCLVGDKANGTDPHSMVAKQANCSRHAGKQSLYAACYGAGIKTIAKTIRLWHPDYPEVKAKAIAGDVLKAFKGKRSKGSNIFIGGTGSQAFNKMYSLLAQPEPCTPLLDTRLVPAVWPANSGDNGSPSQLNATVQQTGSSALHCIVLGNWWLAKHCNIKANLGVTIHDEFCYFAPSHEAKLFAYCEQIVHMWVWSLLNYKLSIYELAIGPLFASAIAKDSVLRKEAGAETATPTSPYNIEPGKEYTMEQLCRQAMPQAFKQAFDGNTIEFSTL